jgi:heat shock protein HslJ
VYYQQIKLLFSIFTLIIVSFASNLLLADAITELPAKHNDAANMTYHGIYDNKAITLKHGQWSGLPFVQGASTRPSVGLIKEFGFSGDINADGTDELVVILWENSGGSGTQIYMAIITSRYGKMTNLSTVHLGDRIQLRMGRVHNGGIELDVIQSSDKDAKCCPGEKVLRSWVLQNNLGDKQLIEQAPVTLGRFTVSDIRDLNWKLERFSWRSLMPKNKLITLSYKDGKFMGHSGCNRYFASVSSDIDSNKIKVGPAASTRMICHGEKMDLEEKFIRALSKVTELSFINGQLALIWNDGDSDGTMIFSIIK